jgi:hypothetical protein
MNPLEKQYRMLLWLAYPQAYLTQREEELVSTLLDAAKPGQRRPSGREAVDLVRSGMAVRNDMALGYLRPATTWAATLARVVLPALAALVVIVHGAGQPWTDPLPVLFLPFWATVALAPLLVPLVSARRGVASGVVAIVFIAGQITGANQVQVPGLTVLGLTILLALALLGPLRGRHRQLFLTTALGAAIGTAAGFRVLRILASPRYDAPRTRDMFATRSLLDLPESTTFQFVVLFVVIACVLMAPRIGLTVALLTPSILICAVTLVGNSFLFPASSRTAQMLVLAWIVALWALLTLTSLLAARRRQPVRRLA